MNATRSFVPTPSALATSTGSRCPRSPSRKSPPNEPSSDSTPGVNVARASALDAPDDLVAGVDVDAGLLVVHALELQSLDQRVGDACAPAIPPALPSRCGARSRRSAPLRSPPRACRTRREAASAASLRSARADQHLDRQRRVAQRDAAEGERHGATGPGRAPGCRRRAAWRRRPAVPDAASVPSARDGGAEEILEALVGDREAHRVDDELLVRCRS